MLISRPNPSKAETMFSSASPIAGELRRGLESRKVASSPCHTKEALVSKLIPDALDFLTMAIGVTIGDRS
jgi:hypothetical protein